MNGLVNVQSQHHDDRDARRAHAAQEGLKVRSFEKNPLDLNNFPDEYNSGHRGRWGESKRIVEEASNPVFDAAKCRKRKCGAGEGKKTCGKVYECRFCSLKFCKSQALGGHMNRHRQERETETLNRARQLVYTNDNIAALSLGFRDQQTGGQSFSGNFPREQSLTYMTSFSKPAPILSQPPHSFPPPPPPSSSVSSSPTTPPLLSIPSSLSSPLLPFHSSYLLPSPVNDLLIRHVSSGTPHREQQQQQQNSGARDFLSCARGEPLSNYQDKRVSWGSTHYQSVGPSSFNQYLNDF